MRIDRIGWAASLEYALHVFAGYYRPVYWMAEIQFKGWHGRSAEEIGLWRGKAVSNRLLIERK